MLKTRGRVIDSSGSFLPFSFVHLNCWVGIATAGNKHKHQQTVKNEASPLSLYFKTLQSGASLAFSVRYDSQRPCVSGGRLPRGREAPCLFPSIDTFVFENHMINLLFITYITFLSIKCELRENKNGVFSLICL